MEMHEIVSRGRTVNNDEARELSFSRFICSILCRKCHQKAHTKEVRTVLLQRNVERYGYYTVRGAFDRVQAAMKTPLDFGIPGEPI